MKTALAFISIILFAGNSFAASSCGQLKEELKAMQAAQQQIMNSLVNNHETFASSLEEYSVIVKGAKGASSGVIAGEMSESSQAFRARGIKGKKMANKLNEATTDLLARVAACLK